MSNMQNPHSPDPQDPITVTREDLRLLFRLARPTLDPGAFWRSVFIRANYPYSGWKPIRQVAEALGEWPVGGGWITLEEARERWGE